MNCGWKQNPEIRRFSEFFWFISSNKEKLICPVCSKPVYYHVEGIFGLDKIGKALFKCEDPDCEFNKMNFVIEACL